MRFVFAALAALLTIGAIVGYREINNFDITSEEWFYPETDGE